MSYISHLASRVGGGGGERGSWAITLGMCRRDKYEGHEDESWISLYLYYFSDGSSSRHKSRNFTFVAWF
jgi:hypothetical protein